MDDMEELRTESLNADNEAARFHDQFYRSSAAMMERLRDELLEGPCSCTDEEMVAQLMMIYLFPHPCDPELNAGDDPTTRMTTDQKKFLVGVASHMGPDWAQALYHAAVFITKVA